MGQKTHPLGFRLGITQEHRSAWYADFKNYSNLLEEDDKLFNIVSAAFVTVLENRDKKSISKTAKKVAKPVKKVVNKK